MGRPLSSGSWGGLPFPDAAHTHSADWRFSELPLCAEGDSLLARGWGRSYGDVGINSGGSHLDTTRLDRLIAFDRESGVLHCESGVTLAQILDIVVPEGWFVPVLPGSRFVTVGGAIANDVHGKNHPIAGSFGCHVLWFDLVRSDGSRVRCSANERLVYPTDRSQIQENQDRGIRANLRLRQRPQGPVDAAASFG